MSEETVVPYEDYARLRDEHAELLKEVARLRDEVMELREVSTREWLNYFAHNEEPR